MDSDSHFIWEAYITEGNLEDNYDQLLADVQQLKSESYSKYLSLIHTLEQPEQE